MSQLEPESAAVCTAAERPGKPQKRLLGNMPLLQAGALPALHPRLAV